MSTADQSPASPVSDGYPITRVQRRLRSLLRDLRERQPTPSSSNSNSSTAAQRSSYYEHFDRTMLSFERSTPRDEDAEELRRHALIRQRSTYEQQHSQAHTEGDRRDPKRRKTDDGVHAQVGKERLQLELAHDDGGSFQRPHYPVHNILRNDTSVYCSRRSSCNLILQHQSRDFFSLAKLVIRGPATGYTSPVSEGMVFVSSTTPYHSLLHQTAGHQPAHRDDSSISVRARDADDSSDNEDEDYLPLLSSYECPYGEEDDSHMLGLRAGARAAGISFDAGRRKGVEPDAEYIVVCGNPPNSGSDDEELEDAGVLEPHARFWIRTGQSRAAVIFDPPLYCRYIMIKMWASRSDKNIDIQSITGYGYYGKRMFPAAQFR